MAVVHYLFEVTLTTLYTVNRRNPTISSGFFSSELISCCSAELELWVTLPMKQEGRMVERIQMVSVFSSDWLSSCSLTQGMPWNPYEMIWPRGKERMWSDWPNQPQCIFLTFPSSALTPKQIFWLSVFMLQKLSMVTLHTPGKKLLEQSRVYWKNIETEYSCYY